MKSKKGAGSTKAAKEAAKIVGKINVSSKGVGYVEREGFDEDIEIENAHLKTALHNDEVEVELLPLVKGERQKGEVVKILERAKMRFVGVIEVNGGIFLTPDDRRMYRDILIPEAKSRGVKTGDKVLVKITNWSDVKKSPEGEVLQIIGKKGEHNAEMEGIVLESGFEIGFPAEVEREAEEVAVREKARFAEEILLRKDFRGTLTCTIDPFDAKDFDDAISFKEFTGGTWMSGKEVHAEKGEKLYEIGVHIADVSHYVREGTALDREAIKRGLSVYLVDRTIPMLPEILSNDLCSLNPREDKMAFSAVFVMNERGEIKDKWFGKTVINSDKRFTYENAQETLDDAGDEYHKELTTLNGIAKKLQAEKFKQGAIEFETEEVKFRLDENGVPIEVYKKQRLDTHKLVEEYMLLANREVAEFLSKGSKDKKSVGIYRIHDNPDPEKIIDLSIFIKALGFELKNNKGEITSKDINNLLKQVEGSPQESLIKTAAIRSMAKAVYSTKNVGHFGLAFKYYTHFTSPIRRYPDLVVHRMVERQLKGGAVGQDEFAKYEKMAIQSSEREVVAADAERASIKYKQVEYMKKYIGEVFDGTITGVAEWGIYVEEVNTKCEGMVKLRDLGNDFYTLDKKNYSIVGERTKKRFSLGDKVKFKVIGADMDRRTLDYIFV